MKKLVLTLVAVLALTAGCGSKPAEDTATTEATTTQTTDASSSETGADQEAASTGEKVVIVTSGDTVPYSLMEGNNEWTGIEPDMWAEIEKRTGWDVEVKRAAFDGVFGELDSSRADVAANCFAQNAERGEKYYMTIPFYGDAQCLALSESNTDVKTFDDLKGKRVGVTNGQASQPILEEMANTIGFELVMYETMNAGYSDLSLGRIDAMGGPVTGVNQFNSASNTKLQIMDEKLKANNVVYYLPKTERGAKLRDELNVVLQEMLDDGTCGKITEKWLFEDMTPYITKDQA